MFDENTPEPPAGLPTAPASASAAPTAPAPAPVAPSPAPVPTPAPPAPGPALSPPKPPRKKGALKAVLAVVLGIIIIGVAGYIAYTLIVQAPGDEDNIIDSVDNDVIVDDELGEDEGLLPEEEDLPPEEDPELSTIDSDGDGMLDVDEAIYGTDPFNPDTDQDGLGDREEVQVYGTDPLDPDTDGDSYLDGQEVAGGFNPNGEGKLFELPK